MYYDHPGTCLCVGVLRQADSHFASLDAACIFCVFAIRGPWVKTARDDPHFSQSELLERGCILKMRPTIGGHGRKFYAICGDQKKKLACKSMGAVMV